MLTARHNNQLIHPLPMTDKPNWSTIDTVMFDMDGTLLDLHFDNYFWQDFLPRKWAQHRGLPVEQARAALERRYTLMRGSLDWYCLDFWTKELEMEISPLKQAVKHKIAVRPGVSSLLANLAQTGKRMLLVTNAHPDSLALKLEVTGIATHFHQTISAHTLKLAKENQGFWAALQGMETYNPQRTLLVDDSLAVLRQAHREGIRHLYGIHQPDSHKAPLERHEFPMIEDFAHIMPESKPEPAS